MGVTPNQLDLQNVQPYSVTYWYQHDIPEGLVNVLPSDSLEKAFQDVAIWHERHSEVWNIDLTEEEYDTQLNIDPDDQNTSDDELYWDKI